MQDIAGLVVRQAINTATTGGAAAATSSSAAPVCTLTNDFDGRLGVRISAIFVILLGSVFGMTASPWLGEKYH